MSDSQIPTIGDIETEFRDDIVSDRFDQYLFVTYRVSERYLELFSGDDSVVIHGPEEVGDVIESGHGDTITWQPADAHAKCYLMWNENTAKVWLGSFNLTETGLRTSIEWGVTHEAGLDTPPALEDIQAGTFHPESVTSDVIIQQVLDVLLATVAGGTPSLAPDIRRSQNDTDITLLTNGALPGPNGFHEGVSRMLERADENVQLTYCTPFVTAAGVEALGSAVPDRFDDTDFDIEIRTCRIEAVDDSESYLDQADLQALDDRYGSVELLARSSGQPGEELEDRSLRSGLAHFKLLIASYRDKTGTEHAEIMLTSANLSYNAWGAATEQLEFGLWVRDRARTKQLVEFFRDRLLQCYSTPNRLDFELIAELESKDRVLTKQSVLARLADRLSVTSSEMTVEWGPTDPPLDQLTAIIQFQEVTTGETDSDEIELEGAAGSETYRGQLDEEFWQRGWILQHVELTVTTAVAPREYAITTAGHNSLETGDTVQDSIAAVTAFLDDQSIVWNRLVLNEEHIIESSTALPEDVAAVESVRVWRFFDDGTHTFTTTVRPGTQPHLGASPFRAVTVEETEIPPCGGFACVQVTPSEHVHLEPDMLRFTDDSGSDVTPVGYAAEEGTCRLLFSDRHAGATLTMSLKAPYEAYFSDTTRAITLPGQVSKTDSRIRELAETDEYQFTHVPDVTAESTPDVRDKYITSGVPVTIEPAPTLLTELGSTDQLGYEWRRQIGGYRAPRRCSLADSVPPNPAHSRVEYRGVLLISDSDREFSLPTPTNRYTVNQQVFQSSPQPDPKVARGRDINAAGPDDHAGWLVFTSEELLRPSVRLGPTQSIHLEVTIDDAAYDDVESYPVSNTGEMFFIPLFSRHLTETITVTLRLHIDGGATSYGASELVKDVHHQKKADGIRRTIYDTDGERQSQIDIWQDSAHRLPRLGVYQHRVHSRYLEGLIANSESFTVEKRTPTELVIEAHDMTLLHLGSYSP